MTKIIDLRFDAMRLLPDQLDAAIKAQREMRQNLVYDGYKIISKFRLGLTSTEDCDRLDRILEDLR